MEERTKGDNWLNNVMGRCNMYGGEGVDAIRKRKRSTSINKEFALVNKEKRGG